MPKPKSKTENILMRTSEREKEEIKAAAEKMQMSMSEFLLYCVRKELTRMEMQQINTK